MKTLCLLVVYTRDMDAEGFVMVMLGVVISSLIGGTGYLLWYFITLLQDIFWNGLRKNKLTYSPDSNSAKTSKLLKNGWSSVIKETVIVTLGLSILIYIHVLLLNGNQEIRWMTISLVGLGVTVIGKLIYDDTMEDNRHLKEEDNSAMIILFMISVIAFFLMLIL